MSGALLRTFGCQRQDFFIQQNPRDAWHVESREHCEYMLCGYYVSVEETVKIRSTWGPRKCPDCWIKLQEIHASEGR